MRESGIVQRLFRQQQRPTAVGLEDVAQLCHRGTDQIRDRCAIKEAPGQRAVPANLRGAQGEWVSLSLRARTVYVHKDLPLTSLTYEQLSDPRWQIDFGRVNGRTRFSDQGFAAEDLEVRFEDHPARFSLRVGAFTGEPGLAARATLDGVLPPQTLLARHPPLGWLNPWLQGSSAWTVDVRVPQARMPSA